MDGQAKPSTERDGEHSGVVLIILNRPSYTYRGALEPIATDTANPPVVTSGGGGAKCLPSPEHRSRYTLPLGTGWRGAVLLEITLGVSCALRILDSIYS